MLDYNFTLICKLAILMIIFTIFVILVIYSIPILLFCLILYPVAYTVSIDLFEWNIYILNKLYSYILSILCDTLHPISYRFYRSINFNGQFNIWKHSSLSSIWCAAILKETEILLTFREFSPTFNHLAFHVLQGLLNSFCKFHVRLPGPGLPLIGRVLCQQGIFIHGGI